MENLLIYNIVRMKRNKVSITFVVIFFFLKNISATESPTNNEIIAQVGPERITRNDYQAYLKYRQTELMKKSYLLTPQNIQHFQKKVLDEILEQTMIFLLALRENISYSEEEFIRIYNEGIQMLGGKQEYERWLSSSNLTDEYIRDQIKRKIIVDKYIDRIRETLSVSDSEIEDLYKSYVKSGLAKRTTDTYDFANILITDPTGDPEKEKKIYEIYQLVQKGEDFLTLAQKYSEDLFSKMQGCCYYEMPLSQVQQEVKHYLVLSPVGTVTPPFRTRNGWNMIKILSKNKPGVVPFEKMKKGLEREIINKKVRDTLKERLEELQKEISITYYHNY